MRVMHYIVKLSLAGLLFLTSTVLINHAYALPRDFDKRCENAWASGHESFWYQGQEFICIQPEEDAEPPWNHGHDGPSNAPDDNDPGGADPSGGQTAPRPRPKPKQCTLDDVETGCRERLFSVNVLKEKTGKCLSYDECFKKYKQYEQDNGGLSPNGRCLKCISDTCKNKIPPSDETRLGFCTEALAVGISRVVDYYQKKETIKELCGGNKQQCYDEL